MPQLSGIDGSILDTHKHVKSHLTMASGTIVEDFNGLVRCFFQAEV